MLCISRLFATAVVPMEIDVSRTIEMLLKHRNSLIVPNLWMQMQDAMKFGAFDFVMKYILYFAHERMWALITFV